PWLITTSGFLSSPGGRMTLATSIAPPGPGRRTTSSRVWAEAALATISASSASIRSLIVLLSRTARILRAHDHERTGSARSRRECLAPAAPGLLAAPARAGAHAAEHPAVLHLAEMHADIGAGSLTRQLELVGFQATDLVTDARGLFELEVGRGIA